MYINFFNYFCFFAEKFYFVFILYCPVKGVTSNWRCVNILELIYLAQLYVIQKIRTLIKYFFYITCTLCMGVFSAQFAPSLHTSGSFLSLNNDATYSNRRNRIISGRKIVLLRSWIFFDWIHIISIAWSRYSQWIPWDFTQNLLQIGCLFSTEKLCTGYRIEIRLICRSTTDLDQACKHRVTGTGNKYVTCLKTWRSIYSVKLFLKKKQNSLLFVPKNHSE